METTHTVGAQELGRVLHNAALFASKATYRPVLCGIELSINGKIEATGTDSYRLGHDECPTLTGSGEATMVLEAKEVAAIAKELLKANSYAEATITTTDAVENMTYTRAPSPEGTEVTIKMAGRTWVLSSVYGEYPKYRQVIPSADAEGEVSLIGLNPKTLADFAKVNDGQGTRVGSPMRMRFFAATKPVLINIGPTFFGVVMPIRLDK